jgi:transposase
VAKERLAWYNERRYWTTEQWRACIWSDECSVELGTGKRPEYCFRTPQQKWDKDKIQAYHKGKACTVMVWAAFCGFRRSQLVYMPGDPEAKHGGVTAAVYQEILEDELPTLWEPGLIFMQDNASIHTARAIRNWFKEQSIEVLDWPPYSPDLNPIEHAWKRLKEWVWKHHSELLELKGRGKDVKEAMLKALQEGWEAIEQDFFDNLIESMQDRVRAVRRAKG